VALYRACVEGGKSDRRQDTGDTGKIKATVGWQTTIKDLMTFRLPLRVLANARDNPRNSLSFFSIALSPKKVKAVHRRAG
jgi:hypothetical protein